MNEPAPLAHQNQRLYQPRISTWWWLKRFSSAVFILREITSVFVAWFVIFWLMLLHTVSLGEAHYLDFLKWAARPGILALNVVATVLVIFHAVTWFNLAPQAMVVRAGKKRVPGVLIAAAHFAAWAVVSMAVVWILRSE